MKMTNYEKYKDEIIKKLIDCNEITIDIEGKIKTCHTIGCAQCKFYNKGGCQNVRDKWLEEEYEESKIDWSKVKIDTPIYVKNYEEDNWYPRYFAKYKNGIVYAWRDGKTSFSIGYINYDNNPYIEWKYAKLADIKK